jgi:hypothetical protein
MRIEFDLDLSELSEPEVKDGQITVKLPKEKEELFKLLNTKHKKRLSNYMRAFAIKLIDQVSNFEVTKI